jgi:DNA polymerase-1
MPLIYVLKNMELYGVKLDVDQLSDYGETLKKQLQELKDEIISLSGGTDFNIDSPKQLGEVLFEKLKITDKPQLTKSKQYSTSEETLEKLKDKHEIIGKILEYRSLRKMISGYVESLPKLINRHTGKIHTSFNQTVTATGRLSSNNPNLQNIPIREERGRNIRKAFIPSDSRHVILAADYSQIELRIMAHLSEDPDFITAFKNNEDIHTFTASKVFGIPQEDVNSDMRRKAKTANFGIIYGISAYGLSQRLNIPRKEAGELINEYFEKYPKVKEYMNKMIQSAKDKGFVQTILGRRRYLKDIDSRNSVVRGVAERNAINAPIQGSASDIIKKAMIQIDQKLHQLNYQSKMILQVHDELVFDAYKDEVNQLSHMVKDTMENVINLSVPLTVETGTGTNWLEAH